MAYKSVDILQRSLSDEVFQHTKDPKKAAGRALGTLVEIITYYLLKTWGLNNQISIERSLEEYGNPSITHNVEYSLHPVIQESVLTIGKNDTVSSRAILKALEQNMDLRKFVLKSNNLLKDDILRNACTIAVSEGSFLLGSIKSEAEDKMELYIFEQAKKPFAMFECKRVGVEEGMKKGPQTIEKAKQGAYVAKTASSLQKIRTEDGDLYGIIYKSDGSFLIDPYPALMEKIIRSDDNELLRKFILTIGIVSNHGNWFTAENQNKELRVLAQSYDWLLFLTDEGLSEFIETLLFNPVGEHELIRTIFLSSYNEGKKRNQFTKVQMNVYADAILTKYFRENIINIEEWFNIISPDNKSLDILKSDLAELKQKNWKEILR